MNYTSMLGSCPSTSMYTSHPDSVELWDSEATGLASSLSLIPSQLRLREATSLDIDIRSSEAHLKSVFCQFPILLQNTLLKATHAERGDQLVEAKWFYEPSSDRAFSLKTGIESGIPSAVKLQDLKKPDFVLQDNQYKSYSFMEMKRP